MFGGVWVDKFGLGAGAPRNKGLRRILENFDSQFQFSAFKHSD